MALQSEARLFTSAENGFLEIVRYLIADRADLNVVRSDGCTMISPLTSACLNGHYNVALILLKAGAVETICTQPGLVMEPRIVRLLARWRCAACNSSLQKVRVCARCRLVSYCTRPCQRAHWAKHKPVCASDFAPTT